MKQIIFLSIIFSFLSCIINNEEVLAFESMNTSITPRVFGGDNAEILSFPYMASIRYKGEYVCSATIVGDYDFLVPAHCFTHKDPDIIWPYVDVTLHTSTGNSRAIGKYYLTSQVLVHPGWTGNGIRVHDIAIAKSLIKVTMTIHSSRLHIPLQDIQSNVWGWVTGWGRTEHNTGTSRFMKMIKMWTLTYDVCQQFMLPSFQLQKEQFCAYQQEGIGCSQGDDGAPLVIGQDVIGIHSWIAGETCAAGHPEINANVFVERDFLLPIIHPNH